MLRLAIRGLIVAVLAIVAFGTTPVRGSEENCTQSKEACDKCCEEIACEDAGKSYIGGCSYEKQGSGAACDRGGCFG